MGTLDASPPRLQTLASIASRCRWSPLSTTITIWECPAPPRRAPCQTTSVRATQMATRSHLWDFPAHFWVATAATSTKKLVMMTDFFSAAPNLSAACPPAGALAFRHTQVRKTSEPVVHNTAQSLSSVTPTRAATAPVSVPTWPRRRSWSGVRMTFSP